MAREMRLNLYPCGHYATERFGVMALGETAAETKIALSQLKESIQNE